MTESSNITRSFNRKQVRDEILRFLESRGRIKAALYYKLEKHLCGSKSKFKLDVEQLMEFLFEMMKNQQIHQINLIIPEPFKAKWKQKRLTGLKYFNDGDYFIRTFRNIKSKHLNDYELNKPYFDSRKIDFKNNNVNQEWINHLRIIIKRVRDIKKKIIIFYPFKSDPLYIYEPKFNVPYNLNKENFRVNPNELPPTQIGFSIAEQAESIAVMKSYRNKFACFYIPLIEAIIKNIESIQANNNNMRPTEFLEAKKFAYSCISYVMSDYVEIIEPNQYRWETFFLSFSIPIKISYYDFEFLEFMENGKIFDIDGHLKYYILIQKENTQNIKKLKDLGYKEFHELENPNYVALGSEFRYYVPFNSKGISFIYFLSKYAAYYFQFLLFYHAFDYIKQIKPNVRFSEKEKILYKKFLPVMSELFGIRELEIPDKAVFKYYTHNADELELIYSKYLIPNVKRIELDLFKYWLFRFSTIKKI